MIKVDLIGFDAYTRRIAEAKKEIQDEVSAEIHLAGTKFVEGAKRDLINQAGDTGGLVNSINYTPVSRFSVDVGANKFYAPFIEFGTKGKYRPIPGVDPSEFKGIKRGNWKDFIEQIKAWVKRKGIGATYSVKTRRKNRQTKDEIEGIAYMIARSIYRNGINPKPFFFKQIGPVKSHIRERLDKILNGL